MRRDLFTDEHELFRAQFRRFAEREIEPRVAQWNRDRITDRETWRRMGAEGFLGPALPETYGGGGATPDVAAGNPIIGSGSSRVMQLGLKFMF